MASLSSSSPGDSRLSAAWLALLFLAYATIAVVCTAVITPPFQNSDEVAHYLRAEQISRFQWVGQRLGPALSGGAVDPGILEANDAFVPDRTRWNVDRVTPDQFTAAEKVHWGGTPVVLSFANTSIYAPFLYAPAVAGIWAGKALDMNVVHTLWLSRVLSGLSCVLVATVAIALASNAAPLLFSLLLLPMSIAEMAAVAQDGPSFALTALAVGILAAGMSGVAPFRHAFAAMCLGLTLVAVGKPPFFPLALLVLVTPWKPLRVRVAGLALMLAATLGWMAVSSHYAMVTGIPAPGSEQVAVVTTSPLPGADSGQQARFILHHPAILLHVAANVAHRALHLSSQFVGVLGWGNITLPKDYKVLGYLAVAFGIIASLPSAGTRRAAAAHGAGGLVTVIAVLGCLAAIFLALYISFTPVGAPTVEGPQGRYLIPPAIAAALLCCQARPRLRARCLRGGAAVYVMAFPIVSIIVTILILMRAFYF